MKQKLKKKKMHSRAHHLKEHDDACSYSCVQLFNDPMDCSLPGSSVHGIFQVRVLEWVAIAFSETKKKGNN